VILFELRRLEGLNSHRPSRNLNSCGLASSLTGTAGDAGPLLANAGRLAICG